MCTGTWCSLMSLDTHSRSYGALTLRRVSSPPPPITHDLKAASHIPSHPIPSHPIFRSRSDHVSALQAVRPLLERPAPRHSAVLLRRRKPRTSPPIPSHPIPASDLAPTTFPLFLRACSCARACALADNNGIVNLTTISASLALTSINLALTAPSLALLTSLVLFTSLALSSSRVLSAIPNATTFATLTSDLVLSAILATICCWVSGEGWKCGATATAII